LLILTRNFSPSEKEQRWPSFLIFYLFLQNLWKYLLYVNTEAKALEELVTPKPIPLVIPKIGVGTWVTLINNVTHGSEVLKIPDTTLKDTPIIEKPKF
jgi:hypothetical protein